MRVALLELSQAQEVSSWTYPRRCLQREKLHRLARRKRTVQTQPKKGLLANPLALAVFPRQCRVHAHFPRRNLAGGLNFPR